MAELAPKPDVPATMRKLPVRPAPPRPNPTASQLRPGAVRNEMPSEPPPAIASASALAPAAPAPPIAVQPLAPARYKVQFTASAEFRDKIERLMALMHPSVPDGDLAAILEQAVTEKLERLEAKRFAETRKPRKNMEEADMSPSGRYIPAPVKRIVRRRDSDQCTFVNDGGRRCTERRALEFHHRNPYGLGGDRRAENIGLVCRAHNAYLAELDYGKEIMEKYRRRDGRVSESGPGYFAGYVPTTSSYLESVRTRDA